MLTFQLIIPVCACVCVGRGGGAALLTFSPDVDWVILNVCNNEAAFPSVSQIKCWCCLTWEFILITHSCEMLIELVSIWKSIPKCDICFQLSYCSALFMLCQILLHHPQQPLFSGFKIEKTKILSFFSISLRSLSRKARENLWVFQAFDLLM